MVVCIIPLFCFLLDADFLLAIPALLPQYLYIDSVNEWLSTDPYEEFNSTNRLRVTEASTAFEVHVDGKDN